MKIEDENCSLLKQKCEKVEYDEINEQGDGLKILIILNQLIGVLGGGAKHILDVSNYWIPANEVIFLMSKAGYEVAKESIVPRSGKRVITYYTLLDHRTERFIVKVSRILKSTILSLKLRTQKYDAVIAPNFMAENMVPTLIFIGKAKLVVFFHGGPPFLRIEELKKRGKLRRIISEFGWEFSIVLARFYDLIFVVEKSTEKYFIERGFDPKKVVVIGNGVHFKKILEINVDNKKYDGVFLGQLIPRKINDLIEVWKEVVKIIPGARLCLIGDGPKRKELERSAKMNNLDIISKGWTSEEDKYKLMKSSKVFVFPSYYESWGIAIAESMACGLPVVAYDQPVYDEIFGNAIIKVNIGDVKEMAKRVADIIKNYPNYSNLINNGIQVASRYDWEDIAHNELLNIGNITKK